MLVDGVNIEILTLEALQGIETALYFVIGAILSLVGAVISK